MASDKGLSIFDEPESAGDAGEETQVLPVVAKDAPQDEPTQTQPASTSARAAEQPEALHLA